MPVSRQPAYGDVFVRCRWGREEGAIWTGESRQRVMVVTPPDGLADCGMGIVLGGPAAGEPVTLAIYGHFTVWERPDGSEVWFDRRENTGK